METLSSAYVWCCDAEGGGVELQLLASTCKAAAAAATPVLCHVRRVLMPHVQTLAARAMPPGTDCALWLLNNAVQRCTTHYQGFAESRPPVASVPQVVAAVAAFMNLLLLYLQIEVL